MPLIRTVVVALLVGTMPASGPISLSQCQTEFGGANPVSLSEYYKGGSYVLTNTSDTGQAIPASGTISLSNFYGDTQGVACVAPSSVTCTPTAASCFCNSTATTCSCTTGSVTCTANGGSGDSYSWQWYSGDSFSVNGSSSATATFSKNGTTSYNSKLDTCNTYSGVYKNCYCGVCSLGIGVDSEHCKY